MNNSLEKRINKILNPDDKDFKETAQVAGWAIYYFGVLVAAAHLFSYNQTILDGFFRIMGYAGSIGIVGNSLVLPRAIKDWTVDPLHRLTAIFFYAVDIFLLAGMVWMNTNLAIGTTLPIVQEYQVWIAPITFINTILTWAFLFTLDPEAREQYKIKKAFNQAALTKLRGQAARDLILVKQEVNRMLAEVGPDPDSLPEPQPEPAGLTFWDDDRLPERRVPEPRFEPLDHIAYEEMRAYGLPEQPEQPEPPEPRNNSHPKA